MIISLSIATVGACVLGVQYGIPFVFRVMAVAGLRSRCRAKGLLVLTYDDGPGRVTTPHLMDLLKSYGVAATFFLLGRRVDGCERILERLHDEGHELGCHTQEHHNAWKIWPNRATADIQNGYRTLQRWVPRDGLYRPPYGKLTTLAWLNLRRRGASIGWWTIVAGDTHDSLPSPEDVVCRVRGAGGGVVLMHDFDRSGADAVDRREFVLRTTELLLQAADEEGWRVCQLGTLLSEARN